MRGQTGKTYKGNPWAKKVKSSIKHIQISYNGVPKMIEGVRPYRTYDGKYLKTDCVIGILDVNELSGVPRRNRLFGTN